MPVSAPIFTIILFAVAIIGAGVIPFLLGFIIQSLFIQRNIPKYISWIIAALIMVALFDFSIEQTIEVTHNSPFLKIFLLIVSVIVIAGFMESGINMRRKMRDRRIR